MYPDRTRSGFSLIEALVVLAIGGMALAIIFSIGVKAGDTGFGLGRRAMSAADSDIAASDLRTLLRSLALRPSNTFLGGVDQPVVGDTVKLEGDVVLERATQCAPQGWAGRLILEIERRGTGHVLICRAGATTTVLIEAAGEAAFSYSSDGQIWNPAYTNQPPAQPRFGELKSEVVWVRFAAAPMSDIVEMASSGRPEAWVRADDGY